MRYPFEFKFEKWPLLLKITPATVTLLCCFARSLADRRNTPMPGRGMLRDICAENPAGGQASFDPEAQIGSQTARRCLDTQPALLCRINNARSHIMSASGKLTKQLCLECGMCCNGVLFKDVELQPGDAAKKLRALGLPIKDAATRGTGTTPAGKLRFPQPCAALCADNRCRLYADRPSRCREFECALLKAASSGRIEISHALRHIRAARRRADIVVRLLRALGDQGEHLPLSRRFKNTRRRVESRHLDDESADLYGQLTLAVHDLNLLLAQEFYPGRME